MSFVGDFPIASECIENSCDCRSRFRYQSFVRQTRCQTRGATPAVVFVKCDVTKRAQLENLIKVSQEKFGDVPDVYIAGAAVFEPSWSNFWDDTEEDRYAQVDINVKFARIATRALLGKNKKGVFLIVSSLSGFQGTFIAPLYSASKHTLTGFVRSMADLDRMEGVKVVACAPGIVATPLWEATIEKMDRSSYKPEHAMKPERVAEDMLEIVVNGKYPSGSSLESSLGGPRVLGTWNIPEPKASETPTPAEFWERNHKIMADMVKKERGGSKLQLAVEVVY